MPPNRTLHIERPIRAFGLGFAGLSLLFCVATPFADASLNRELFFFAGVAYSAVLLFVVIGCMLLPPAIRTRVTVSLYALKALGFASIGSIWLLVRTGRLDHIGFVTTTVFSVFIPAGAALFALAIYGWLRWLALG
jgi:hypothetical protein